MSGLFFIVLLLMQLNGLNGEVEKIYVDRQTRLYAGKGDGRVHVFHGLAAEDSGYPWTLAMYSDEQIELMKSVSERDYACSHVL